jgi:hypothetical protein
MNALDEVSLSVYLLDVLRGPGSGAKAQQKARKESGQNLLIEIELLKSEIHNELKKFKR